MPGSTPAAELAAAIFERQPPGKFMWLRARGASMFPLVLSGDSLKVLRCGADGVRRGDVALVRASDGLLVAHFVVADSPVRTSSFLGAEDAPGSEVLGRVVAIRRGRVTTPLPAALRTPTWLMQRAAHASWHGRTGGAVRALVRRGASSASGRLARRALLGRIVVRALGEEDAADALALLARFRRDSSADAPSALRGAVGAFAGLALVGYARVDSVHVLRDCFLRRRAAGLGVEDQLLTAALRQPVRRAEVDKSQTGFLEALERRGFVRHHQHGNFWVLMSPDAGRAM